MSKHKHIDKICCIAVAFALLLTVVFMNGESLGIKAADTVMGYENRLFDTTRVHTVNIVMDDWDSFIDTAESEEYSSCSVVIDGEAYTGVGIRGKGNTSLSSVSSMGSQRYSFKIEFDQYDSTKSYYGLDKLSLNNLIQDNTYMKDYLTYRMMGEFGVAAPLCSYVYITVNGEDWGLYLAVEGVEDAFLRRNYGSGYGELYKPDSMSFGGGRGNGMDFDFADFDFSSGEAELRKEDEAQDSAMPDVGDMLGGQMPDMGGMFGGEMPDMGGMFGGQMPDMGGMFGGEMPDMGGMLGGEMPDMGDMLGGEASDGGTNAPSAPNGFGGGGGFGMGSSDVKLQYIDDDPDSYSNIFDNAKTDITDADRTRLIQSLKKLSSGEHIDEAVSIDEVIRYFVVHNFVVNGDSYTGSMIHNYYLYEEDGQLSMIPWDYNLAYGTFMGSDASGTVNDPIDTPLSSGGGDRPMIDWIFDSEEYTELYHQYFSEFISEYFDTGYVDEMIASTTEMIAPYVESDPTRFCTYEDFQTGAQTIRQLCSLRAQSVSGQLDGSIPSTSSGQSADSSALVDAAGISISTMGTMGNSMGGGFGGGGRDEFTQKPVSGSDVPAISLGEAEAGGGFPGTQQAGGFGGRPGAGGAVSGSDAFSGSENRQEFFAGQMPGSMSGGNNNLSWVMLAVSAAVLAGGLLIVCKYRR